MEEEEGGSPGQRVNVLSAEEKRRERESLFAISPRHFTLATNTPKRAFSDGARRTARPRKQMSPCGRSNPLRDGCDTLLIKRGEG